MSIEIVQVLLSIGGLIIALVGLPLLYVQLRDVKRSLRSAVHAAIYDQAANFHAHLVQHPNLRKYFFDSQEISRDDDDYDRVATLAGLYLNYLEHMVVLGDNFGNENRSALDRFSRSALARSPILRQHLAGNQASYSDALHRILATDEAKVAV